MTKHQPPDPSPTLAETLGAGYAHVQHWMDLGIEWGLQRMQEAAKTGPKTPTGKAPGKAERIGRGILGFFGKAGGAYYETYEKLKKERKPQR